MLDRSAPVRPAVWRAIAAEVDVGGERLAARVDLQDRLAAREIGGRHENLPVEAAGAQQRGIEVLEAVRGGHDDHLLAVVEAVQLDEQLVQRLVLLAVEPVARARCADRVQLVDEHDRGRILACLLEELSDSGGAEAGEHLDEGRGALRVEARARLVGDRLREQRLAGARRPVEQDPLRDARAETGELLRVPHEVDDLLHLVAHFLEARDFVPRDRRLRRGVHVLRRHPRHHLEGAPEQIDDQAEHQERQPDQRRRADQTQDVAHVRHASSPSAARGQACSPD